MYTYYDNSSFIFKQDNTKICEINHTVGKLIGNNVFVLDNFLKY